MSYLNAHSAKGGYAQGAGGYFYIIDTNLAPKLQVLGNATAPSGSGGSWNTGSFAVATLANLPGGSSTLFGSGRIVRDMGKTVVSAGRTFRKIKGILPTLAATALTGGVANADGGLVANSINSVDTGYLTFYVEMGRDGINVANLPQLVRFM